MAGRQERLAVWAVGSALGRLPALVVQINAWYPGWEGASRPNTANRPASLDDLVGAGEDRWRHGEAERLRGLEVDHQLEFRRLLDRQIGWLGAVEDLPT